MKRALAVLLLVAAPAAADDQAEIAKGLQNLANILEIARYLETKSTTTEVPVLPVIDPWGNAYVVYPDTGRIVAAGSDGRFDRDRKEPEQFTGLEGDVVFADGNFVRTNHNWLCAQAAPSSSELQKLREAELLLLLARAAKAEGKVEPMPQPVDRAISDDPDAPYLRLGDGVKAPVAIERVEPTYPDSYRRLGINGIVILELAVSERGTVDRAALLKSLGPALDAAALEAVRKWKFAPGTKDGNAVPVLFKLTINFRLN